MSETVRIFKLVIYEGNRDWVESTVANSIIGTKHISFSGNRIHAFTIGQFPENVFNNDLQQEIYIKTLQNKITKLKQELQSTKELLNEGDIKNEHTIN